MHVFRLTDKKRHLQTVIRAGFARIVNWIVDAIVEGVAFSIFVADNNTEVAVIVSRLSRITVQLVRAIGQ